MQKGADLSHWNPVHDYKELNKLDFVFQKCTQGINYIDPTYQERFKNITTAFGAYHFADGGDPVEEAKWFLKNTKADILILDWEIEHKDPVGWCKAFRAQIPINKKFIFYTNDARALKYAFPKKWIKWIARYKDYSGTLDMNFQPKSDWNIWQYTSRGKVEGVDGNVDLNVSKISINENTMADKTYHIDSKLEEQLRRIDKKFDGDKESSHEDMSKELKKVLDEYETFSTDYPVLMKERNDLKEENIELKRKNGNYVEAHKLNIETIEKQANKIKDLEKANKIQAETLKQLETEYKQLGTLYKATNLELDMLRDGLAWRWVDKKWVQVLNPNIDNVSTTGKLTDKEVQTIGSKVIAFFKKWLNLKK